MKQMFSSKELIALSSFLQMENDIFHILKGGVTFSKKFVKDQQKFKVRIFDWFNDPFFFWLLIYSFEMTP